MESWNNLLKNAAESWSTGSDQLGKELDRARALVKEKNYEEALKAYMTVFEDGRETSPFVGVRLSYVLSEVAQLGKVYEPALITLLKYREAHEQKMLRGEFSRISIDEWSAICDSTDKNYKIDFYDSLKRESVKHEKLITDVRWMIWLELIDKKRYAEFSPTELAQKLKETALLSSQQYSPSSLMLSAMPHMADDTQFKAIATKQLLMNCSAIYECALGLKKQSLAKKAFKLAMFYEKTGQAYARFIFSADRGGNKAKAMKLVEEAKWCLPESQMQPVRELQEKLNL